ncbi:GNAT family N-acetyltransferase [Parahaliea sp. F7430]|uniref:GNAT family N-acetyltransferase n=1 Tax=Sediminihaliea albiluteola TaxID=2758564 RepID=A0A7W2TWZ7_9GAMM|nr:GNAT family N-acetyltransferase [Sediminihaliea albiluteola]MBA6413498.1 GNAT family N-acetyltransferase [Sediminihaliea albiluteola]
MPGIKTPRLLIESLTLADADFILSMLNDPDFVANVADRGIRSLEQARQYIADGPLRSYRELGFGMYILRKRSTRESIGVCGLFKRAELKDVDIGYGLLPAARGQGLALEAAQGVYDYATSELGLTRLVAIVAPTNAPSIKLLEKLGLRYESEIQLASSDKPVLLYAWQA